MPYIHTQTNAKLTKEQIITIKEQFGKAIELLPGKTERWLMLDFEDGSIMFFGGSDAPCAICEVKIYGSANDRDLDKFTAKATEIVSKTANISPDRIYVKYEFVDHWGMGGSNF